MSIIERIDACINELSNNPLSSVLPKCEAIALEVYDYDNWLLLRLQSINLNHIESAKEQYVNFYINQRATSELIAKRLNKTLELHIQTRTISKDKVLSDSVYDIENKIASTNAFIEAMALPEGLTPIDLYFKHEGNVKTKIELLGRLGEMNTSYNNMKATVSNILVNLRQNNIHTLEEKGDITKEIKRIFINFHNVAKQLRSRYKDRNTLDIEDEYDVQDLLHALLKLYFEDIRAEEWTPSYAGGNNRMDFLIKNEKTVIEVKMARKGLSDKILGEQLIVDIEKYKSHPDCKKIICFVYDPLGLLGNPAGIMNDLNATHGSFVEVIIKP
jgi:hypothetical protein